MLLGKEHYAEIDHYLKDKGVRYWDLRIEMIDHILSDIEENATSNSFKEEFMRSLTRIGWQGNLKKINSQGWVGVNQKFRKSFLKGVLLFFHKGSNLVVLGIGLALSYVIAESFSYKIFQFYCSFVFLLPYFFILRVYFISLKHKLGRSVHLDYGAFYATLSFLILPSFIRISDSFSQASQIHILIALLVLHYLAIYSGFRLYSEALNKTLDMRNKMKTL